MYKLHMKKIVSILLLLNIFQLSYSLYDIFYHVKYDERKYNDTELCNKYNLACHRTKCENKVIEYSSYKFIDKCHSQRDGDICFYNSDCYPKSLCFYDEFNNGKCIRNDPNSIFNKI